MIITTGITVDVPTTNGNIYPRAVVEDVIESFNKKARNGAVPGGILNRMHIQQVSDEAIRTRELFINESGVICAKVDIADTEIGRKLMKEVEDGNGIVGRPLMSMPTYVEANLPSIDESVSMPEPLVISEINEIIRVQVEYGSVINNE